MMWALCYTFFEKIAGAFSKLALYAMPLSSNSSSRLAKPTPPAVLRFLFILLYVLLMNSSFKMCDALLPLLNKSWLFLIEKTF